MTSQSEVAGDEGDHGSSDEEDEPPRRTAAPERVNNEASEKSISASAATRGNKNFATSQAISASFEESRGLSILGSKSSLRTSMARQASSRSSQTSSTKSSSGDVSSGSRSRPRNGSSTSSTSSPKSAKNIRERSSRQNKSSGTVSQPESLLKKGTGDDDSCSEEEEVFLENVPKNNRSSIKSDSHAVGKEKGNTIKSYQNEDEDDGENDDSGAEIRNKSLCGLPPTAQRTQTGKNSVLDSSFSSMPSLKSTTDESVGTVLSEKKPGLLVENTTTEDPMQHFLGGLTSAIEKKQKPEPAQKSANLAWNSSLNASFNASALSSGHLARAAASALGPHPHQNFADGTMEDESLRSLMSFATESSKPLPNLLGKKPVPNQRSMSDDSCPSLMSYGGRDDASMPSLASYRTGVGSVTRSQTERLQSIRDDESLPSLWSMPDESQINRAPKNHLETIDSESDLNKISADEDEVVEEQGGHFEQDDNNDQENGSQYSEEEASSYEESLSEEEEEVEAEAEEENSDDNSFYDEEEEYSEESEDKSIGEGSVKEARENYYEDDAGATINKKRDNQRQSTTKRSQPRPAQTSHRQPSDVAPAKPTSKKKGQKGKKLPSNQQQRQDAEYEPEGENTAAAHYVVKPKKKKQQKPGTGSQNNDQFQKWKEEFEQEQLLEQQQQMQEQMLLQQQQMLQQQMMQQYWMTIGSQQGGEYSGGYAMSGIPGYMVDASGNMIVNPAAQMIMMMNQASGMVDMTGQPSPSGTTATLMAANSGHSAATSGSLQSYSDHQSSLGSQFSQSTGASKKKKAALKKSQSLDYDFSFLDNPEMAQVDNVNANDVLKPMNPSQDEDDHDDGDNPQFKGKKKSSGKKSSLTARFTKSVKKIMKPSAGAGAPKKSIIKTGQHDKQFFPDMDDDDDEEFTMKGLLSR